MDLAQLTDVLNADGPFVTVLVESESDVEQAADKYDLEWKNVLRELEQQGVDARTLEAISAARGEHSGGASRLVVATPSDGSVRLAVSLDTPPRRPVVDVAPLPHLLPLVEQLATRVPHVVVLADHRGADVVAYFDVEKTAREVTVKGTQLHLKKVQVGGWAHHRYQHRTENQWQRNAQEAAATAAELAEQVGAELIIGIGEERQLTLVQQSLPTALQDRWRELPGGRGHDGSEDLVPQRVADLVARHAADKTLTLLAEYAQELGQVKRACDGVEDVVAALRKAQVETLLVTTSAQQDRTLFYGPDPSTVGTTAEEVKALGVDSPKEGPLVDVLIRAALGTGADVQLVPHEADTAPNGGVGAVLRYADHDNASART